MLCVMLPQVPTRQMMTSGEVARELETIRIISQIFSRVQVAFLRVIVRAFSQNLCTRSRTSLHCSGNEESPPKSCLPETGAEKLSRTIHISPAEGASVIAPPSIDRLEPRQQPQYSPSGGEKSFLLAVFSSSQ